ncbi:MAG: Peptide chain release factor 2 [Candidatus Moranbacteria bacterium GW2011_GWA2_39_41]|nr:MAG: Peptide chain release factor 2 [Candidatus Moranbacteria bacterium GW2011_GWA2_39_41]
MTIFDLPTKIRTIADLEWTSAEVGFWDDSQKASKIMQELEELRKEIADLSRIETEIDELLEMTNIVSEDSSEAEEIRVKILELEKDIDKLEFKILLGGEYDRSDVIMAIHSGAGGVDAQDWAEMLLRMYLRWAEKNGFKVRIVDESRGAEAGIKSATVEISGHYAFGYLKSEAGVHRLVRLSPFNSDNLRQTSFALVEILPVIEEIKDVVIDQKDLRIDVYRSSGAGGQSVNTTDSAVRIMHIPTGVVATCQNERSQIQNREQAMKILRAKLHQKYLSEKEAEKQKLRGEFTSVEWGSQIRSYVVHPYKMVKDHRTKHETTDAEGVLDGNLTEFMEAYLKNIKK